MVVTAFDYTGVHSCRVLYTSITVVEVKWLLSVYDGCIRSTWSVCTVHVHSTWVCLITKHGCKYAKMVDRLGVFMGKIKCNSLAK